MEDLVVHPEGINGWSGPYLSSLKQDPWRGTYVFNSPGPEHHKYEIVCFGADRKEGGTGDDEDIYSWQLD